MVRRALSPVEREDLKREHVVGIGEAVRLGDEGLCGWASCETAGAGERARARARRTSVSRWCSMIRTRARASGGDEGRPLNVLSSNVVGRFRNSGGLALRSRSCAWYVSAQALVERKGLKDVSAQPSRPRDPRPRGARDVHVRGGARRMRRAEAWHGVRRRCGAPPLADSLSASRLAAGTTASR